MTAGVYLHIPFCKSRCSYCDFATDVYRTGDAVESYVSALLREIDLFLESGTPIDTIYFGGGTPSLLSPHQLERTLKAITNKFNVEPGSEITMEMNPATVTLDSLAAYRLSGINRASFGVQTFDDRALKLLARGHNAADARRTFEMLRAAGFENISFDLIAGLPGQTLDAWRDNLDEAMKLGPEHISLYLLEIHEGTPLAEQVRSGRQPTPDEDLAAEMYELMLDRLAGAGYKQYEISNFARAGYPSRHNTKYWRLEPVFGFGVSAHSFDGTQRYANERDTGRYVDMIENAGTGEVMREQINAASEFVFLGLRLNAGVDLERYELLFGSDLLTERAPAIDQLVDARLVDVSPRTIKLTRKGMLFSNVVFAEFV
ncbi:MAG: radical SAM family heme chaperone HemW [Pyrinomonadaceae bacterium]